MNRRTFLYTGVFGAGALASTLPRWLTNAHGPDKPAPAPAARMLQALSITHYQAALTAAFNSGAALPADLATLAGINQIEGFLLEPGNEVVMFGFRDSVLPPIELDDLLVGLRSAYRVGQDYATAPGCTIDPMPNVADPWRIQLARVLGMPRGAPMGARHLEVDYQLKKLSAGLAELGGSGATPRGVFELMRSGSPPCSTSHDGGKSATHRFWFCPAYPKGRRYLQDEKGVAILHPVNVQVMTEEEFLRNGERVGAAPPGQAATEFAASITRLLTTNDVPAYSRLRNDFRVIEAAKLVAKC